MLEKINDFLDKFWDHDIFFFGTIATGSLLYLLENFLRKEAKKD